jgi:predicted DNA-binding transcriptional regulator YafY
LYTVVQYLHADAPPSRAARDLASRFEVSTRTIERHFDALRQAGVPIYAQAGRRGGYVLGKAATLRPLNFTAAEAVAVAIALARSGRTPFGTQAGSALSKVLAAMPEASARASADARGVSRSADDPESGSNPQLCCLRRGSASSPPHQA